MSSVQPTREAISRNFETMPVTQNQANCYGAGFLLGVFAGAKLSMVLLDMYAGPKLSTLLIFSPVVIPLSAAAGAVVACMAVIFHRLFLAYKLEQDFLNIQNKLNIERDIIELQKVAERGHCKARFLLGSYYDNAVRDNTKALLHYKIAADLGYLEAQYETGRIYEKNHQKEQAASYYARAADQGDKAALHKLVALYENNPDLAKEDKKVFEYYREAANDQEGTLAERKLAAALICGLPDKVRGFTSESVLLGVYLDISENG